MANWLRSNDGSLGNRGGRPELTAVRIVSLSMLVLLVSSAFPQTSVAATGASTATAEEMTFDLLVLNDQYRRASLQDRPAILSSMVALAQQREQALLLAMASDTASVLRVSMPAGMRQQFPGDVQLYLEKEFAARGTISVLHADGLASDSKFYYTIEYPQGRASLHFVDEGPELGSGSTVSVRGVMLANQVAVGKDPGSLLVLATPQAATGSRRVAVILFNFQDNPVQPYTNDSAKAVVFTGAGSVRAYYSEVSFGQLSMTGFLNVDGDVFGWYTVPYNSLNCPYSTAASSAEQLAAADGFNTNNYNHVVYAFPSTAGCPGWGWAYINGKQSWVQGSFTTLVAGHELGHNFGVHHASSYSCTENGVRVPISAASNCVASEYADPFDIMGNLGTKHMNNFHKGQLGWYTTSNALDVTTNGTYSINPDEWASSGLQVVRIPRDRDTSGNVLKYYYLEFRQPYGFDNFAANSAVANGLSIRIAPPYKTITQSWLIDTTPATSSFSDSALLANSVFEDKLFGIVISTVNVASNALTMSITFGTGACVRANPSVVVSPSSQWGYPGQTLNYNIQVTNADSSACPASTFTITPSLPAGWSQAPASSSVTLSPGASSSSSVGVTPPSNAAAGPYLFTETAANSGVPGSSGSASATYNVQLPDTTPPSVTINSPSNGATLPNRGSTKVSVSATDASGISQIQISIDGISVKVCLNVGSCQYNLSVNGLKVGTHTITATAWDKASVPNPASASVTVTKK